MKQMWVWNWNMSLNDRDFSLSWSPILIQLFRYFVNRNDGLTSRYSALSCYCADHAWLSQPPKPSQVDCFHFSMTETYLRPLLCIICFQNVFVLHEKQSFVILCFWKSLYFLSAMLRKFLNQTSAWHSQWVPMFVNVLSATYTLHSAAFWWSTLQHFHWRRRATATCSRPLLICRRTYGATDATYPVVHRNQSHIGHSQLRILP
jgi:hypothetical protein